MIRKHNKNLVQKYKFSKFINLIDNLVINIVILSIQMYVAIND